MLIECPSCAATYELPESSITPPGRRVRCAACKTMWLVEPLIPVAESAKSTIEERFAVDDLRLAGLDTEPEAREFPSEAASEMEPVGESLAASERLAARLRTEATMIDDPAIGVETDPENSQDDVDALFSTPSLSDFNGTEVETAEEDASKAEAPILSAAAPRKSRARMGSGVAKKPARRLSLAAAASIAIVLGLGLSVLYRAPVVAAVPQMAKIFAAIGLPVNLRGVEIRDVVSKVVVEQGTPQLIVEGEIVNIAKTEAKLSRLRFAVRSEKGQEIYSWKAAVDKPALEPGEHLKFRRRLVSPPDGSADVLVRFETRGDMIAGVQ